MKLMPYELKKKNKAISLGNLPIFFISIVYALAEIMFRKGHTSIAIAYLIKIIVP